MGRQRTANLEDQPGTSAASAEEFPQSQSREPSFRDRLFRPADIAPLVFFRVTFGFLMLMDLSGYLLIGEVYEKWVQPRFRFKYFGFEWVTIPPGEAVYLLVMIMMVAAAGVMLGAFYKFSATIFFLGTSCLFLLDQSTYLNHHYLICVISGLAIFLPLHRSHSLDALRRPGIKSDLAPAWILGLLRAQMAIVYFYGGIAKLNSDWFQGEPVRIWFAERAYRPLIGPWLNTEAAVYLVSYGGVLFDLLIVPLLLWRKTRPWAFCAAIGFHLTNAVVFRVGVFPFLSIALTALFFTPAAHRGIINFFSRRTRKSTRGILIENLAQPAFQWRGPVLVFLAVYLGAHLLIPFRHLLYPGNPSWTEEGHRFAWHMMLRRKAGSVEFIIYHRDTGYAWKLDGREDLTDYQYRKMTYHPDMLLQYAWWLRRKLRARGYTNFSVHALAFASLNGRPPALLIDPETDLASTPRNLQPADWILPLENRATIPPRLFTTNSSPPIIREPPGRTPSRDQP